MMKRPLTLMAVCLAGVAAFAQWSEPTLPTEYATTLTKGNKYLVKNADSDQFIGSGTGYNLWETAATMVDQLDASGNLQAIVYVIDDTEDDYGTTTTFINNTTGYCTFVSNDGTNETRPGWGEMHVDMTGGQGYNHFQVEENGDGTFCFFTPEYPSQTDEDVTYSGYWGWVKEDAEYPQAVWAMLDKTDAGNHCNWQLIDMMQYVAQCDLYDALLQTLDHSSIDQTVVDAATKVYEDANATPEELETQVELVMDAIKEASFAEASEDNPVDMTNVLVNPTLDYGIDGWVCTFIAGETAINAGWNNWNPCYNYSTTYVNHEGETVYPTMYNYIEAWSASSFGENPTYAWTIGDAELSQTLENMRAGKYILACDAMAVQQGDEYHAVTGVQLFATGGDLDSYEEIHTANGIPEHVTLEFVSAGGDLVIGLRTVYTEANWIGADNFELQYLGEGGNAYKASLNDAIENWNAQFPSVDDVFANAELKATFSEALATAEAISEAGSSTNDDYIEARDALNDAGNALSASVTEYEEVTSYVEYCNTVSNEADEKGWEGLTNDIADYRDNLQSGYEEGTLTGDDIANIGSDIQTIIVTFISANAQPGDDISIAIRNHSFDTDMSGWDFNDGVRPSWGGYDTGTYENNYGTGAKLAEIGSGDAEVFETSAFNISQTLPNMPVGLYTLTCQAFERDDAGDGMTTYLYAIANGEETNVLVKGLTDESSETNLYNSAGGVGWPDDQTTTDGSGNVRYIPDSMWGANVYFYAGYYVNTLPVLMLETGDLTIGLRDASADWIIFDNFSLVYNGNEVSSYVDMINELIAEAHAIIEVGYISQEAESVLEAAIDQGSDALAGTNAADCIEAMQALQTAIAAGNESHNLVTELAALANYANSVSLAKIEGNTDDLLVVIDEIQSTIDNGDGYMTDADVVQAEESLKVALTNAALSDCADASEENPVDISAVIMLASYADGDGEYSYVGWDLNEGTGVAANYGAAEIYNQEEGAGMSQILYNLNAGYYRLGVQGFYRPTTYATTVSASTVANADTIHYVDIFVGGSASQTASKTSAKRVASQTERIATHMLSIYADADAYSSGVAGSSSTSTYTIPASMEEAANAFAAGLYQNILQFEIAEDGTDVPIGIVKTGYVEYDWVILTNWTLEYVGTTEPADDPTTAVEGVEGSGDVLATAIYSVNGTKLSHLTKGVNIVKTTLSDGTVKVSKVLVM